MNEGLLFCLAHSAVSADLIWQIFNLQFETLRAASRLLRLCASAVLFAILAGMCAASLDGHYFETDWPQLVLLLALSYLVRRVRRLPTWISVKSLTHPKCPTS